jgi:hypothetical protein
MKPAVLLLLAAVTAGTASADSSNLDAAIGGGLGGAAGAAIGNELGGREGAILGGALGGAVGTAISTEEQPRHRYAPYRPHYYYAPPPHPRGRFCPPGLAKQGRC